jgi:hypothetical protein
VELAAVLDRYPAPSIFSTAVTCSARSCSTSLTA